MEWWQMTRRFCEFAVRQGTLKNFDNVTRTSQNCSVTRFEIQTYIPPTSIPIWRTSSFGAPVQTRNTTVHSLSRWRWRTQILQAKSLPQVGAFSFSLWRRIQLPIARRKLLLVLAFGSSRGGGGGGGRRGYSLTWPIQGRAAQRGMVFGLFLFWTRYTI